MARKAKLFVYDGTVEGAISDAWNTLEELASEMREAFDNTPESLQNSGAGEARGIAADALENLSEPDVPEGFGDIAIKFEYRPFKTSRAGRRDEAVNLLDHVVNALNELEFEDDSEKTQERDDFVSEVEDLKDSADSVEFPGMYG